MAQSSTRRIRLRIRRCIEKDSRIEKDRISELPQNTQETILGFLPIQDAVRTSILSKKWRHCWTMIPHLIFDYQFANSTMDKFSKCEDFELKAHKFVSVINEVLLLHHGPILTFSLVFPDDICSRQVIHDYINQWIPLFSRKGIKKLTLEESSSLEESYAHHFSSLDLTHLRLRRVWFPYTPAVGRFPYLTILELVDTSNSFREGVFDCPMLDKLTLILCQGLFPNNFRAPNLKCLHHLCPDMISEYSLAGFENLAEYSFLLSGYPYWPTKTSNLVNVLGGAHKLKKFSIAMNAIKYLAKGGSPNRLAKPLACLKTISISCMNFKDLSEVSCLHCLIRSVPNLCELNISTDQGAELVEEEEEEEEDQEEEEKEKGNLQNYWIEDAEDCNVDHLEKVTFSYFKGLNTELEFIKFLLAHSPSLKTMLIHRSESVEGGVALKMAEEMLQYSRASSRAQIRRLRHPIEIDEYCDQELWDRYDISTRS